MENKEMQKSIPVELKDEILGNICAGTDGGDTILGVMPAPSSKHEWDVTPGGDGNETIPSIPTYEPILIKR